MMGRGDMGGMMHGHGGEGPEHEAMMSRMRQMEKRMDMIQMMMEQNMRRPDAPQPSAPMK